MPAPILAQHGQSQSGGGTTTTITITTSSTNHLVVVASAIGGNSTSNYPILSIAGAGLTWTAIDASRAASGQGQGNCGSGMQLWWAIAAAQLTSQVVTITSNQAIDDAATCWASFTGAYNAAPVDPHAGAKTASFYNGVAAPGTFTLSSSNANDIAIVVIGSNAGINGNFASPAVLIEYCLNGGGARYATCSLGYRTFSSAQSGVGINTTSEPIWGHIGAMFTADAPSPTSRVKVWNGSAWV